MTTSGSIPEADYLLEPLTDRELDVLRLLADGCSNRDIGEQLFIGVGTVKLYNQQIYDKLQKPIIAVTENEPRGNSIHEAIKNLPDYEKRKKCIDNAGMLHSVKTSAGENNLYFHVKGISEKVAKQYLKKFAVRSRLPECLLLSHKIGSGLKENK